MASEKLERIIGHAQRAERSFHEATADLTETRSQIHGWNDSVGSKAYTCYERILNEWKKQGTADIQALKSTAHRLDFDASQAQILDAELRELSAYLATIAGEVNHG